MTLTDILPLVDQLTPADKLKLIHLLAENLDLGGDVRPFEPGKVYALHTPYNSYGAARILAAALTPDKKRS